MTKILTVANLKGGTAKTTTTVLLGHAINRAGLSVAMVDADPQESLTSWSDKAGFEIPVVANPVTKLHTKLSGIFGNRFDVIVIDTPPLDEQAGIVYGALRAATSVLVPIAPTTMEYHRLGAVWSTLDELAEQQDREIDTSVLITRALANAVSTREIRAGIEAEGRHVLETTISRLEAIGLSYGEPVTDLFGHDKVVAELQERGAL